MSDPNLGQASQAPIDYQQEQQSERFQALRRTQRSFVFPMALFFLAWYFAYVILAGFAPDFMATPVFGTITIGLLLGLGQFVTTFVITMLYVRFANQRLDPLSRDIREDLEKATA